jgi:hypothetical protein
MVIGQLYPRGVESRVLIGEEALWDLQPVSTLALPGVEWKVTDSQNLLLNTNQKHTKTQEDKYKIIM